MDAWYLRHELLDRDGRIMWRFVLRYVGGMHLASGVDMLHGYTPAANDEP